MPVVAGPSWLHHLGVSTDETSMGRMGGTAPAAGGGAPESEGGTFRVSGADLYRLECRSCHGPDGAGAPPEIHSLLDPVRATSAAAVEAQMKARGRAIPPSMAEALAAQADSTLRLRLAQGGEKMPAFADLDDDEVAALIGYLRGLAGVPADSSVPRVLRESADRVGGHLLSGTCHVCHDAVGPGTGPMGMMSGVIPSLASIPREQSLPAVEQQVRSGSTGMGMGMGMMMRRGPRMPAYPYLTREEVAAAYRYLAAHPPRP
ncbi:MAG: c-type cytochrome [Hyphomicrobiales bacterium]